MSVAFGCARTYLPAGQPAPPSAPSTRISVEALRIQPAPFSVEVRLRIQSAPGTRLFGARLALRGQTRCRVGVPFDEVDIDQTAIAVGPADVGGQHEIDFTFGGRAETLQAVSKQWSASTTDPISIDIDLQRGSSHECARVPLVGAQGAPAWHMDPTSAGFSIEVGGRVYPLGYGSSSGIPPNGAIFERVGAAFGPGRGWAETAVDFTDVKASNHLVLATGGDAAFWETGPLALRAGLGYELALNYFRADLTKPASHRYTFHGPRVTLGVSYALIRHLLMPNLTSYPYLESGHRTMSLELEFPVSLWFGTGGAPRTTLVPGVGFGVFWAL